MVKIKKIIDRTIFFSLIHIITSIPQYVEGFYGRLYKLYVTAFHSSMPLTSRHMVENTAQCYAQQYFPFPFRVCEFGACDWRGNVLGLTKMGSGLCLIEEAQRFHLERTGLLLLGHSAGSGVVLCGLAFLRLEVGNIPFPKHQTQFK